MRVRDISTSTVRSRRAQRLEVARVPHVLAHDGTVTGRQAGGGLELTTDRQGRPRAEGERDGERGVAATAADGQHRSFGGAHHRVVAGDVDGAIVVQPGIGDAVEAAIGLDGVGADRFFGQVGRGHHQDGEGRLGHCRVGREQQMVEGCVGARAPRGGRCRAPRPGPGAPDRVRPTGRVPAPPGPAGKPARRWPPPSGGPRSEAATSGSRTITANGLAERRLRFRRRSTASVRVASTARW
jgi:hypothetical protein